MNSPSPKPTVSTWPAAALVVSNMIGIGVFTALGYQIDDFSHANGGSDLTGSVFPLVMLWIVGGALALCGALCYAELATALPRSGGEYNFLSRIYHPAVGFCTGLCSASVGFAAPIAASGLLFANYLCRAFPELAGLAGNNTEHIFAFVLIATVLVCQLRSLKFAGGFQALITGTTVLLIVAFIVVGFGATKPQPVTFLPHTTDWKLFIGPTFGSALIWVMYSYSGWNAAAYIVEEVRNPGKALPRALIFGTLFVMVLYVTINCVFLYTTPLDKLSFTLSNHQEAAHIAGAAIFGASGARIVSGLICVGLVANVSAMMWVGSRVSQAIGATYPVLGILGRTSKTRVPYVALLYQFGIIFALLFSDPNEIVNYVESVLLFWSLLTVLGVIVLRLREPNLPRPYRTWGYPVTPIIFAIVALVSLIQNSRNYPMQSLIGAATVLIGIPIYFFASRNVPAQQLRGESLPESST